MNRTPPPRWGSAATGSTFVSNELGSCVSMAKNGRLGVTVILLCLIGALSVICIPGYLEFRRRQDIAKRVRALKGAAYRIATVWPSSQSPPRDESAQHILEGIGVGHLRYYAKGHRFILSDPEFPGWVPVDMEAMVSSSSLFLANQYDPTNGTVSPGLLSLLVIDDTSATPEIPALIRGKRVYPDWFNAPLEEPAKLRAARDTVRRGVER